MPRAGGIAGRILEAVEQRTGQTLVRREEYDRAVREAADGRVYAKELEYVGWTILNHVGGQSHELRPESRKTLALKSLNAYISDPNAGRIVDHYVAFVLGRGVPRPQARDPEVQARIDAAWDDRANRRHLTSAEKLVEQARAFVLQQNLYFVFFDDGADGMVRMSSAKFDTVDDVYRHPQERARVLFYVAREKQRRWNPTLHAEEDVDPGGQPKVVYYESFDAFDEQDTVEAAMDEGLWLPPAGMLKPGKLLHLAGNKTHEMAFGVPSFKRLLRWFTAYNEVMESFTERMKAAAKLYMRATVTGGKSAVERAGLMAVRRAGSMSMPEPVEGEPPDGGAGLPREGRLGVVASNDALRYEPFKIDSGASDLGTAGPVLRSMIATGGGFVGQHFFGGDPGSQAGSQSVELPVLKFIELEQEVWRRPFVALADRVIARSVELGFLEEWRPPTEREAEAISAGTYEGELDGRGQVKRDLTYDFALPSPLQRMMGDVVSAAVQTATGVDPNGDFPELSRWLFGFILAEAFDVQDPQRVVDEVLPPERVRQMEADRREAADLNAEQRRLQTETQRAELSAVTGADGRQHPPSNPVGARQKAPNPEERRSQQARADRAARASRERRRTVAGDYAELEQAALGQLAHLAAGVNANGAGPH